MSSEKKRRAVQILLLTAAAVFIFLGVQRGEPDSVLAHAVNICMECIGLG